MLCSVTRTACRRDPALLSRAARHNNPVAAAGLHGLAAAGAGSRIAGGRRHVACAAKSVKNTTPSAKELRQAAGQLAQALGAATQSSLDKQALDELRHIHSLAEQIKNSVDDLEFAVKQQTKLQSLRWALDNLETVDSFSFQVDPDLDHTGNAEDFIKDMLWYAMKGDGINCWNCMLHYDEDEPSKSKKQRAAEFREAIADEVHMLVGIRPRQEEFPEGWAMFID